jgi:AraC-like DNA-binding protein
MSISATVKDTDRSVRSGTDLLPRNEVTRRHSEELMRNSEHFGDVRTELFSCRAQGMNELEVLSDGHTVLLRCDGTASRMEVVWPESSCRQRLSEFRPGCVVFSPASCTVRVTKKDQGSYRYISVHITPSALAQLNSDTLDATRLVLPPQAGPCHPGLCRVALAMKDEMDDPGPAGILYRDVLALQLLIQLVRCACRLIIPPVKGGLPAWRLRRAIEMLEADLTDSPSIQQLAAAVDLTPGHFCTAFKQSTGYSPHRYLVNRKIAKAKELMANRNISLTEIALSSGFSSSSQFATTFRRINGGTPSAYRRGL